MKKNLLALALALAACLGLTVPASAAGGGPLSAEEGTKYIELSADLGGLSLEDVTMRRPWTMQYLENEEEEEDEDLDEEEDAPRLSVYTFSNPSRLISVGDNEYAPPEGMEPILVEHARIESGVLEQSGTDLAKEMVKMIECQRAYSYALRMVMTSDEVESTINSLRA